VVMCRKVGATPEPMLAGRRGHPIGDQHQG
jgi:hypothetical protein